MLNGRIWYATGGKFYYRTWDGANAFGAAQLVDPYDDPYWDNVANGFGPDLPGDGDELLRRAAPVTGMFYANRSIYYTLSGSKNLFKRAFSPDTKASSVANQVTGGIISPVKTTVISGGNPVDFSNASGMFVANGSLWYATKSDGKLHKAPWNGSTVTGASTIDALATGNWAAAGVFLATGTAGAAVADFSLFVSLSCSFKGRPRPLPVRRSPPTAGISVTATGSG